MDRAARVPPRWMRSLWHRPTELDRPAGAYRGLARGPGPTGAQRPRERAAQQHRRPAQKSAAPESPPADDVDQAERLLHPQRRHLRPRQRPLRAFVAGPAGGEHRPARLGSVRGHGLTARARARYLDLPRGHLPPDPGVLRGPPSRNPRGWPDVRPGRRPRLHKPQRVAPEPGGTRTRREHGAWLPVAQRQPGQGLAQGLDLKRHRQHVPKRVQRYHHPL